MAWQSTTSDSDADSDANPPPTPDPYSPPATPASKCINMISVGFGAMPHLPILTHTYQSSTLGLTIIIPTTSHHHYGAGGVWILILHVNIRMNVFIKIYYVATEVRIGYG